MAEPQQRNAWLALAVVVVVGFLVQTRLVTASSLPVGDEGHFIEIAGNLLEGRGFTTRIKHHFYPFNEGVEHPDDTRQPLVPLLFAGLFALTGVSYAASKILLVSFNLLNVLLIHRIGAQLFGTRVALATAALVALYPSQFFFWTGIVQSSEPIFTTLLLLVTGWTLRGGSGRLSALGAGGLCGLLYLTRANGLWLLPVLGLQIHLTRAGRSGRRDLALALAGFLLVAAPWLLRNAIHFGNPLYTSAQHNYWLDSFHLFHSSLDYVPGPASYFASHSGAEALARLAAGARLTLQALLLEPLGLVFFLPFSVVGAVALGDLRRHAFGYGSLLVTLLGVVWYAPAYPVERFLVPFHPLILLWSVGGVARLAALVGAGRRLGPVSRETAVFGLVLALLALPPLARLEQARGRDDSARYQRVRQLADWIATHTDPEATVMVHSGDRLHQLLYQYDRKTVLVPNDDFATILAVARRTGVDHLVVSRRLVLDPRSGFDAHWAVEGVSVVERALPAGLQREHRGAGGRFVVYRLADADQRRRPSSTP